jgi:nicotinamidase-related amidase
MRPALLVIDVQKQFFQPNTVDSLDSAIKHINAAIALFREKDYPIIAIQNMNAAENLLPGEEGFDLPESLDIQPSDIHIHKAYGNSFNKTPLAENLRDLGVDTVVVTGYSAAYCVLSGYRGAQDVDLNAMVLLGAIASPVAEYIKFVENITDTISLGALRKILT